MSPICHWKKRLLYLFTAIVHTELPKLKRMASYYSLLSDRTQNLAKSRRDTKEDRRSSMRRRGGLWIWRRNVSRPVLQLLLVGCISVDRSWSFSEQHLDLESGSFRAILCMTSELRK